MIRNFKENDLDRIMQLWLETNSTAHCFIPKNYWQQNYDAVRASIPNATVFVYEEASAIIGFLGLTDSNIAGIFVDSNHQSKGIGKKLLTFVKQNRHSLTLQVYKHNTRAIHFYQREGFTVAKEQVDLSTHEAEFMMKWEKP